jgi:hypothetical protein
MKSEVLAGADKATLDQLMSKACIRYPTLRTWTGSLRSNPQAPIRTVEMVHKQRGPPLYSKPAFLKVSGKANLIAGVF